MARHATPLFAKRHYEWLAVFIAERQNECKTPDQRHTVETWMRKDKL